MCGRFAFFSPADAVLAAFGVAPGGEFRPRFNIAPSQDILTIRSVGGELVADQLRWGLVPFWAKDPAIGQRMINARAETAAEKPSFRQALRRRRCLIPADGFYEWTKGPAGKQPWFISATAGDMLAFAGLWEEWRDADDTLLQTCTILTTGASAFMSDLHHRMPVILGTDQVAGWLDPEAGNADIDNLLAGTPAVELQAWQVSRKVNSPLNDEPDLIEARQEQG